MEFWRHCMQGGSIFTGSWHMLPTLLELKDRGEPLDPKHLDPFKQQMSQLLLSEDEGSDHSDRPSSPIPEFPLQAIASLVSEAAYEAQPTRAKSVSEPAAVGALRRREYRPYSEKEIQALHAGVARHGVGKWKEILRDPELPFHADGVRTVVDLKDKWRHLVAKRKRQEAQQNTVAANHSTSQPPQNKQRASARRMKQDTRPPVADARSASAAAALLAGRGNAASSTLSLGLGGGPSQMMFEDAKRTGAAAAATDRNDESSGPQRFARRSSPRPLKGPNGYADAARSVQPQVLQQPQLQQLQPQQLQQLQQQLLQLQPLLQQQLLPCTDASTANGAVFRPSSAAVAAAPAPSSLPGLIAQLTRSDTQLGKYSTQSAYRQRSAL